jgi:predicted MPP superfamily phosphohydrolase
MITRRNALRLIAGGAVGSIANAAWIEPARLSVTREDIACRQLPTGLDGLRMGLLTDFHFRPDEDAELLEKVIARANSEDLDVIALGGDFVDHDRAALPPLVRALSRLRARHGVFAVMGNHDGWNSGPAFTRRELEGAGISFLHNHHSRLNIRGEALAIAGTDFVWYGKPDPARTLRGIPGGVPLIAMVHEPDYFDVMTTHRDIMLQVSGHTHGGQCRVPLIGYAPVSVKYGEKYIQGHAARGSSNLFVSRGVGTTGPRVRFACPPELAILTLRCDSSLA